MKRRDVIAALREAGLDVREGGNHTLVFRNGVKVSAVPRHREIKRVIVRAIERQTGVRLLGD